MGANNYSETYLMVCDYDGVMRDYKSESIAKREAKKYAKRLSSCCMSITVEVYKETFNPFSKTLIAEYEN